MMRTKEFQKWLCVFLLILLVLVSAGCGKQANEIAADEHKQVYLSWATGGTAGTFYGVAGGIASVIKEKYPWIDITVQTGGTSENNRFVGKNEAQLGFTSSDCAYFAYVGEREYSSKYEDLTAVLSGPLMYQHLVVRDDSDIYSMKDLAGKRVSIGAAGTLTEIMAEEMIKAYGLENDVKTERLSLTEAVEALKDKRIDGIFHFATPPVAGVMDIATTTGIRLIDMDEPELQKVLAANPTWTSGEIAANSYQDQEKSSLALASYNIIVANKNVEDDVIYAITKTILENNEQITEVHPSGADWNAEAAASGLEFIKLPIHPGAEKYLKEIGAME